MKSVASALFLKSKQFSLLQSVFYAMNISVTLKMIAQAQVIAETAEETRKDIFFCLLASNG